MTVDGRPRPRTGRPTAPPPASGPAGPPPAGRHARPERRDEPPTPPRGHPPRHARPEARTEVLELPALARTGTGPLTGPPLTGPPLTGPPLAGPPLAGPVVPTPPRPVAVAPAGGVPVAAATPEAAAKKPLYGFGELDPAAPVRERVRVVLAERRAPTRAVRTVAEIEQQTETGEFLLVNLIRAQLALAVRLVLVAVLVLGTLPLLLVVAPSLSDVVVLGVRLPWWLLGVAPYPFLLGLGRLYAHYAERNERDFADDAED